MAMLCHLLSIPDLVRAKKTQRDKDWPMIRRLLEADYFNHADPDLDWVRFWLRELRTPELLMAVAASYPDLALEAQRPLLAQALAGNFDDLEASLQVEEFEERRRDRDYWLPLKKELEALRRGVAL